jgi:SAM-dependent methyltransferase
VSDTRCGFGGEYLDWKGWDQAPFGDCDQDSATYYAAETAIRAGSASRVLEIGFGNGACLGWLKSQGAEVYGIEMNPVLIEAARGLLGTDRVFGDPRDPALDVLTGTFTHVLAFDVFEHVPQDVLGPLLARLGALLKPEGRIVARFPNGDSPFGRIYQHGDPTHVTTIGRAKLEYFARRAGLAVERLGAPALPATGFGVRLLRRWMLKAGRAVFERIVGLLYFGGRRVPLDPNYVAVLRRVG